MLKMTYCLRRLPPLSREEFQRYWREQHAPLVRRHAPALGIRRYVQSHTLSAPGLDIAAAARGSSGQEFDGVAELWWDGVDGLLAAASTPAGRAGMAALLSDEAKFIDLPNSPIFFVQEIEIVGDAA